MSHEFYTTNPLIVGATLTSVGAVFLARPDAGCWHHGATTALVVGIPSLIVGYITTGKFYEWRQGWSMHSLITAAILGGGAWKLRGDGHPILFWMLAGLAGAQALGALIGFLRWKSPMP